MIILPVGYELFFATGGQTDVREADSRFRFANAAENKLIEWLTVTLK
jgi:hypothetical protein